MSYLNTLQSLRRHVQETSRDKNFADRYSRSVNCGHSFDKLGDPAIGWNGNLHPINFIYNYIGIRSISVRDLMSDKNSPIQSIAFSQGPASFLGTFRESLPAGRLYYQCEIVFKNPLEDVLTQIADSIDRIDGTLSRIRPQYLEPATDRLGRVESDVVASTAATVSAVQQLTETIKNIHP